MVLSGETIYICGWAIIIIVPYIIWSIKNKNGGDKIENYT